MVEAILACAGAAVGFILAWVLGGKLREQLAESRTRQGLTELQLIEAQATLARTKAELSSAVGALQTQNALRAAAEALNARVPDLETELEDLRRLREALHRFARMTDTARSERNRRG